MKQLFLLLTITLTFSCSKDNENTKTDPQPEPEQPAYRTVIRCVDYKWDTIYTASGYMIPRWVCIERRIDTIR